MFVPPVVTADAEGAAWLVGTEALLVYCAIAGSGTDIAARELGSECWMMLWFHSAPSKPSKRIIEWVLIICDCRVMLFCCCWNIGSLRFASCPRFGCMKTSRFVKNGGTAVIPVSCADVPSGPQLLPGFAIDAAFVITESSLIFSTASAFVMRWGMRQRWYLYRKCCCHN